MHKKAGRTQARFGNYRFFTWCYLEGITELTIADI